MPKLCQGLGSQVLPPATDPLSIQITKCQNCGNGPNALLLEDGRGLEDVRCQECRLIGTLGEFDRDDWKWRYLTVCCPPPED